MGLAYTNQPIARVSLAATPPLTFLADLNTLLLSVGWVRLSDYDNGSYYQIESPQGLKARVRIWYPNAAPWLNCFALQMVSAAVPTLTGYTHHFLAGKIEGFPGDTLAFSNYWVWANCCQLFIGADHPESFKGSLVRAVQCGVPHSYQATSATPECMPFTASWGTATELFFSGGDDNGVTMVDTNALPNFRTSYFCSRYTLIFNGQDFSATIGNPVPGVEANALQLDILRTNVNWPGLSGYFLGRGFIRPDGTPLAYDPMMSYQGYIFGELWDACLLTIPMALEATEEIFENETGILTRWVNYTKSQSVQISTFKFRDEGRCYSLLLLIEPPEIDESIGLNVAY